MDNDARNRLLAQLRAAAKVHLDEMNHERERAIEKMQAPGANDDAKILLDYLIQSDNELLRPLAASRLSEIGGQDVVSELVILLETGLADDVIVLILQVLAEIGDESIFPALIKQLDQDNHSDVRRRAVLALGKTGGQEAFDALMDALDSESDLRVRQQVIEALGWLGNDDCVPDLVQIMQTDPDKETQTFAAEALGRLGSEKCLIPLMDTLADKKHKPIVRYYAAHALGLLGNEQAVGLLQTVANDPDEHGWVVQMASESLERFA